MSDDGDATEGPGLEEPGSKEPGWTDSLDVLGDETCVAILRALANAGAGRYDADPLSYSGLFERSGLDDSTEFDYHLRRLSGRFVAATDAGYTARYPGRKLLRALAAGHGADAAFDEAAIDGTCPHCGSRGLVAARDGDSLSVGCEECGRPLTANTMPPAGFEDRDVTEVLDAYDRLVRHRVGTAVDGVCPECAGTVSGSVTDDVPRGWEYDALIVFECAHCGFWVLASYGLALFADPDALAFLRAHRDAGVVERRFWELPLTVSDAFTAVESRNPWRVRVTVPGDGERLVAEFDGPTLRSLVVESGED